MSVQKVGKAEPCKSWRFLVWMVPGGEEFCLEDSDWQNHPAIKGLGPNPENDSNRYKTSWLGNIIGIKAEHEQREQEYREKCIDVKEQIIRAEYENKSQTQPIPLHRQNGRAETCYLYKSNIYKFNRHYSDEEMIFQIMELEDKERQKFERLKHKFTTAQEEEKKPKREPIPEDVRITVWRRDEGKCSKCGSREKLEYDHIVPVAKGGSNTARNIELLCEQCNRSKSANIQ